MAANGFTEEIFFNNERFNTKDPDFHLLKLLLGYALTFERTGMVGLSTKWKKIAGNYYRAKMVKHSGQ